MSGDSRVIQCCAHLGFLAYGFPPLLSLPLAQLVELETLTREAKMGALIHGPPAQTLAQSQGVPVAPSAPFEMQFEMH